MAVCSSVRQPPDGSSWLSFSSAVADRSLKPAQSFRLKAELQTKAAAKSTFPFIVTDSATPSRVVALTNKQLIRGRALNLFFLTIKLEIPAFAFRHKGIVFQMSFADLGFLRFFQV